MNAKEMFRKFAAASRLRHTDQREAILDVFLATERHLTVQELYELVRRKQKGIGYATVARAVKLFEEAGICRPVDFSDGTIRYEHKYGHEHHDHLICIECGRFVEIYSDKLEQLQNELVRKQGYVQKYHKLNIFGVCPHCREKR